MCVSHGLLQCLCVRGMCIVHGRGAGTCLHTHWESHHTRAHKVHACALALEHLQGCLRKAAVGSLC